MRLSTLNKTVLLFKNKAVAFLNGLTSNEVTKPQNAFLNIHGRIIATFDQLKISDDEVVILIEQPFVNKLLQHVNRYAKLSGVTIEQPARNIYFDLDADAPVDPQDWVFAQKKGRIIATPRTLPANVTDEEFRLFRVANGIPIQGVDYTDELLLNVSMRDHVSFTKGCYLGQEPISKVYNRSQPSWKLVVKREDECSPDEKGKMTSKVSDPATGNVKGFVFVSNKE
ncbi:MAG: hypothetical protein Q7S13_04655 [Candidatus Omnitrophota bacterium]|nr:hypothetical protein [Candidatus Omnitrophota bacterium]